MLKFINAVKKILNLQTVNLVIRYLFNIQILTLILVASDSARNKEKFKDYSHLTPKY